MVTINRQITLYARPDGYPKISDFRLAYAPLPTPGAGEVLVRSAFLSLDYATRLWMDADEALILGQPLPGCAVGFVLRSEHPDFAPGDIVYGMFGWQEYAVVHGRELNRVDEGLTPISIVLGTLGLPGLTAYFGLLEVAKPRAGDTVVVSGAAGGIGTVAGQIARLMGCRVIGVTSSPENAAWLVDELGFHGACVHPSEPEVGVCLDELCPAGIDVYFDITGGPVTDAVVLRLNPKARVAVCGQMEQYPAEASGIAPRFLRRVLESEVLIQGFKVSSFEFRYPEALAQLREWVETGELDCCEDIAEGIEATPQAFIAKLNGRNQGKQLVRISRT